METVKLSTIAGWTGGRLIGNDVAVENVSTDSRKDTRGSTMFIAIKGMHYNGHDFLENASRKGAAGLLLSEDRETSLPRVIVEDTGKGLRDIAMHYLEQFNPVKIAVTGSTGKTTFKDLLYDAIESSKKIKTEGNTNNLIGVPLNILRIDRDTEYAVIEMGMNSPSEISELSRIFKPDCIVITSINNSHIGNFNSFDELINAKMEIFDYAGSETSVLINGDNRYILDFVPDSINYSTFGMNPENTYHPGSFSLDRTSTRVYFNNTELSINIPGRGAVNLLTALYGFSRMNSEVPLNIESAAESFDPPVMRLNIINLPRLILIDDSYNSSPASLLNAAEVLERFKGRKIAVLGDMLELGKNTEELHTKTGGQLRDMDIDMIITLGNASSGISSDSGRDSHFTNIEALNNYLSSIVRKGDVILVKGSRSMGMEKTVSFLKDLEHDL
ncbi:MAG: UDP-N-acetylmuramoyl-tripeptide--D-alanyl-D-alanine ligase [bacterium]